MKQINCSTGEKVDNYEDYLETRHWKQFKERYAKSHKKQCTMCDEKENIHLHHITYNRVGNEKFEDVVYLCRTCHLKVHETDIKDSEILGRFVAKFSKLKTVNADCKNCFHNKRNNFCSYYKIKNPNKSKCRFFYYIDRTVPQDIQRKWDRRAVEKKELTIYNRLGVLRKMTLSELNKRLKEKFSLEQLIQTYEEIPSKTLSYTQKGFSLEILTAYLALSVRIRWENGSVEQFEIKN
ncbi:HNH endonuclease signature motif containing protein [Metabacillus hrfriensis]|uniref:HNH endonuclease signature motif containing protein n=1 Tax=Metabacillus hrfriensis TaxID=3048891 RepID=A0ACD4RI15_9BACI|nr:HNH endonuclease signature motif containing protein [Metabacillus sp. CT-WN-B3]WHZ60027.1 HNH endonuclease signature motif containing protein [Metabacillus sp. CT-WN-B3]